ncbi:MAG: ferredoxin [Boseongicola sp.]|nr:ferredoxin [Boseongicola sp.]
MTLADIAQRVRQDHLDVFGAFHTDDEDGLDGRTVVMLGPHEPGFWPHFSASPEATDGHEDPLDRWSTRIISAAAQNLNATPLFPFGTPRRPFMSWALRTGRAWSSPVRLLVHDTAGLWVSYRGALIFPDRLPLPPAPESPCETCQTRPCLSACPVSALTASGYNLAACHAFLDTADGQSCMKSGCNVRKTCPQSQKYHRMTAQSAFHMDQFHSCR